MVESQFKFSDPKVLSFGININPDFDQNLYDGFQISNTVEQYKSDEEDNVAFVILKLSIGDESNKYPFYIKMSITAKFKNTGNGNFDSLLDVNAPALLLSYSRPIISFMTSQCGFKPFNIPYMNFTKKK